MKKTVIAFLATAILISGYGCEKKSENNNTPDNSQSSVSSESATFQPDPQAVKATSTTSKIKSTTTSSTVTSKTTETTSVTSTTVSSTTNATVNEEFSQPDPLGAGAFSYDENGALQFDEEPQTDNEQLMMSAGQALFESACRTQWLYTVGCPYSLDMNSTAQNGFGWTYYKITDENIHSFADIENDYYEVFSDRYPNEDLKMLYLELDGAVYALNGQREINPYYSVSKIVDIQSQTNDEIFFTVENHYEGTDISPNEPYSEKDTFSMVISENKIRAGQFKLPY